MSTLPVVVELFRVAFCLCFKTSPRAKAFHKERNLIYMKIKVQTNGFARRLGLTQGNTKEKGKMGYYYLVHKGRG